ncbi:MAG: hypothetical protein ABWK01_05575 [Infirmifilum sp.]
MKTEVELGFKRWLRSSETRASATIVTPCRGIWIIRARLQSDEYLFPVMPCTCDEKHTVRINGEPYCEAEYCSGFLREILSCNAITAESFIDLSGSISYDGAISEDATNPHVLLTINAQKFVLKGYRLHTSWNPEPLFLRFLSGSGLVPKLALSYSFNGRPLGILTEYVPGAFDPGAIFYNSLKETLKGEDNFPPIEVINGIARTIAEFHNLMFTCREDWCSPGVASRKNLEEWRERTLTYLTFLRRFTFPDKIKIVLERNTDSLFQYFSGTNIIATHQDLHFSQMLRSGENFYIVDFEGEPGRPEKYRRTLEPAVRDMATLLRGLAYIAYFGLAEVNHLDKNSTYLFIKDGGPQVKLAREWTSNVSLKLLGEYARRVNKSLLRSTGVSNILQDIEPWLFERALYEAFYEAQYRPENTIVALATLAHDIPQLL